MKQYVTDTHALLWYLTDDKRLSKAARRVFEEGEQGRAEILVPSVVLVESIFLMQRDRVPRALVEQVLALSEDTGSEIRVVSLDSAVARQAAAFGPAAIPEMPDRIIAATARVYQCPVISADNVFADSELVTVIW